MFVCIFVSRVCDDDLGSSPFTNLCLSRFNRNPRVRDSPLDSPERPAEYLKQTRQKLEAQIRLWI